MLLPDLKLNSVEEFKNFNIEQLFKTEYKVASEQKINIEAIDEFLQINIVDGIPQELAASKITINKITTEVNENFNPLISLNSNIRYEIVIKESPDRPIIVINNYSNSGVFIPSNIVFRVDDNVKVDILETSKVFDSETFFANNNREFNIANSEVTYTRFEELNNSNNVVYNYYGSVSKGTLDVVTLNKTGNVCINIWDINLFDEGTCNVSGVIDLDNSKQHGTICKINHIDKETTSNQEFRHILDGKSYAMYDGDSTVLNSAKGSNTTQQSKAIMLSNTSRILNKPRLNIYTGEVKATHGATVGKLNAEDIFYLKQRGYPEIVIKKLLIKAFITDIINRIKSEVVREFVNEKR